MVSQVCASWTYGRSAAIGCCAFTRIFENCLGQSLNELVSELYSYDWNFLEIQSVKVGRSEGMFLFWSHHHKIMPNKN